jgi:two-component system, NarL family, response regulator NreC
MAIDIVLADDHTLVRAGLRLLLEREPSFSIVAEAGDGRAALELVTKHQPDVAVLDIAMPLLNGIETAERICDAVPKTAVIMLSMHSDESYVLRALKAGARGYLLKDSAETDLVAAVKDVHAGKTYLSAAISKLLVDDYIRELRVRGATDSYDLLTARERELLSLIAAGKTTKDIAADLNLSPYTVDTHRSNLMRKVNVSNLAELILYAFRKGLVR